MDEDLMDIPLIRESKPYVAEDDNVQPVIDRYLSTMDNLISKINNLEVLESSIDKTGQETQTVSLTPHFCSRWKSNYHRS